MLDLEHLEVIVEIRLHSNGAQWKEHFSVRRLRSR